MSWSNVKPSGSTRATAGTYCNAALPALRLTLGAPSTISGRPTAVSRRRGAWNAFLDIIQSSSTTSSPVTSTCPGYPNRWLPEVNASDHFTTLHPGLPKGGTGCFQGDVQFPSWDPATPESAYAALRAAWAAPGGGVSPENVWTAEWAATPRFKECYASLSPRFEAEIARGVPPAPLPANEVATNFTSAIR